MSLWKWLGLERDATEQEFDSLAEAETALTGLEPRPAVTCLFRLHPDSERPGGPAGD